MKQHPQSVGNKEDRKGPCVHPGVLKHTQDEQHDRVVRRVPDTGKPVRNPKSSCTPWKTLVLKLSVEWF